MKRAFIILCCGCLLFSCLVQEGSSPELEAHFLALIVSDFDASKAWYINALGFEVVTSDEYPDRGFKQSNLKRGEILLELIELDKAKNPEEIIPDYTSAMRLTGIFKVGFMVTDFDKWIVQLTQKKVDFHGDTVIDESTGKRMVIIKDPDGNRIQIFEK